MFLIRIYYDNNQVFHTQFSISPLWGNVQSLIAATMNALHQYEAELRRTAQVHCKVKRFEVEYLECDNIGEQNNDELV